MRRLTDLTLDLDTLVVLQLIAETGSLSRAAAALGVTQQAVSARVRVAEGAVGQPLVHRSVTGSVMTESGRLLLGLAAPVLEAAQRLEAGVAALRQHDSALVVAASQTIAELLLPGWLLAFRRRSTDVNVQLIAGNSATVAELVRSGRADLGFVEGPVADGVLSSQVVAEDELVVVVAPGHPWASGTRVPPEELAAVPMLVREPGSGTRAVVEAWLAAAGLSMATPAAVLETTSIIRANARAGVAPAIMSTRMLGNDLTEGALVRVDVDAPPIRRQFTAVWCGQLRAELRVFLATLQ